MDYDWNNKEQVLSAIEDGYQNVLLYVNDDLKDDRDVVLAATQLSTDSLEHASARLKDDREFVLEAVKIDGRALEYASDRLKDDREIVLEAVKNGEVLFEASHRLRDDREIVLEAVQFLTATTQFEAVSDRLRNDDEVVLTAVQNHPEALEYASDRITDQVAGVNGSWEAKGLAYIELQREKAISEDLSNIIDNTTPAKRDTGRVL